MGPFDFWSLWDVPTVAVPLRSNKQVSIVLTCDFDMEVFWGVWSATKFSIANLVFLGHYETFYH